jgi:hypothetical protein
MTFAMRRPDAPRPLPHTRRDAVFGAVLKGYGLFGARRFPGDWNAARRAGHRSRPLKGAKVNPLMATRPECPGAVRAAAVRVAVRHRTAPVVKRERTRGFRLGG